MQNADFSGNHEITQKTRKLNDLETTDHTDYTDFLSQIASPQEPTVPEEFSCVIEIQQRKNSNGCLRLGGCLPLRGAFSINS